jgi:hypothetical protein
MTRYALTYGLLSGAVIAAIISAGLAFLSLDSFAGTMWFGYLVMLVALSFIFVGVKRYRDVERGGVIKFWPALGAGLAIALVAAAAYIVTWEIYLFATDYRFMDEYIAHVIRQRQAAGVSAEALAAEIASMNEMRELYANPLFRAGFTFIEIFPVGLIVSLFSAALLRNPKLLPATVRTA